MNRLRLTGGALRWLIVVVAGVVAVVLSWAIGGCVNE